MTPTQARELLALLPDNFLNAWLDYVKYVTDKGYDLYDSLEIGSLSFIGAPGDRTTVQAMRHDLEGRFDKLEDIASDTFGLASPQHFYGRHFIVKLDGRVVESGAGVESGGTVGGSETSIGVSEQPINQGTAIFTATGDLLFADGFDTFILSPDGTASSLNPYNPTPKFLTAMQRLYKD